MMGDKADLKVPFINKDEFSKNKIEDTRRAPESDELENICTVNSEIK